MGWREGEQGGNSVIFHIFLSCLQVRVGWPHCTARGPESCIRAFAVGVCISSSSVTNGLVDEYVSCDALETCI